MSGALKETTIKNAPRHEKELKIWSDIKSYWNYRKTLFPSELPGTDGDFIIQRLLQIQNLKSLVESGEIESKGWVLERGVTDMIKCMIDNKTFKENYTDVDVYRIVNEEYNLLDNLGFGKPQKILLVMLDKNFIQDKVLNEPNRKRYYPDLETYLKKQEEYINFTKQYNDIDEVIEIRDAYQYIDNLKHLIY